MKMEPMTLDHYMTIGKITAVTPTTVSVYAGSSRREMKEAIEFKIEDDNDGFAVVSIPMPNNRIVLDAIKATMLGKSVRYDSVKGNYDGPHITQTETHEITMLSGALKGEKFKHTDYY